MPYDPHFIPGEQIPLPTLSQRVAADAFEGGAPIEHSRFSILFNQARGFALCTAHNIDGESIIPEGEIPRRDRFRLDPEVDRTLQVDNDRGYVNNPWDRGHLVRRRAMHWGHRDDAEQGDSESFFWTNIAPQHDELHSSAWGRIEDWMLEAADDQDRRACVFTGPVLTGDDPEVTNKPGEAPFRIPAGFWKIFAIKHQGAMRAATFLVWQRDFDRPEPVAFDPVLEQVRLTTVEHLTGLSFESLRDADPLQFGAPLRRADRSGPAVASLDARRPKMRAAAITSSADIEL